MSKKTLTQVVHAACDAGDALQAASLDLIVQIRRTRDGKRKVTQIAEVTGIEGDTLLLQDLYLWEFSDPRSAEGRFKATGYVPTFIDRASESGIEIPRSLF